MRRPLIVLDWQAFLWHHALEALAVVAAVFVAGVLVGLWL